MIATATGVSGLSVRTLLKQITPLLYVVTLTTGLAVAANVQGTVSVKNSDVPVPGAQLVLESESSHQEATTDAQGHFAFSGLAPAADYRLVVAATGFQRMVYQSFAVDIAGAVGIRLYLEVIPQSEAVTVEAEIPPVRTDAPEISQTVDAERLASLPSNGRSATRFAMLDPHVRNTQGQGSDGNAASRLSFNGNSFRHTFHALDGASNYDSVFANAAQQTVSVSAIQELKILTNQYSAEYGNSSAGILAIVTRSGTDEFHGEAFGFLRPSGIQAAPPVSDRRLPNERLQAGASAGGPVVRNRTEFFANFEDIQQSRGSFIQSPQPTSYLGTLHEWYALARLDHRLWAHHSLTFRVNANRGDNDNPNDRVGGFVQPNAAQLSITQSVGSQAALNSVFGTAVNQFRISYANTIPSNTRALYPQISIVKPNFSTEGGSANSIVRTETAQVGDVYNWNSRRHSFHAGGDYIRVLARDYSFTPFGEYRFAGPKIQQYTQTFGAAQLRYGQTIATAFLQDDIRWTPKLTVNIGLRHELQSITSDRNNFAPRIGLAFDPTGKGSTVFRAGAGFFYDQYYLYITRRFYTQGLNSPTASYTLFPGDPGFPQFPNSLSDPPARAAAARRDIYLPPSRILNPYSMQFSLGIQQKLFGGWLLTLDGIHAHTMKQMRVGDANAPAPFPRTAPGQMRTAAQADATRAVSEFRTMAIIENSGSSLYDAADLGLSRRFARHYQVEAHYVYSSSANYSMFFGEPDTGIPNDWGNTGSAERGPSDFYQRHRFVGHGVLFLPYDVQFAGVATFGSGLPVNPLTGADNNGDGIQSDRPAGFGRNSFRGSSQANVDLSLSKRVRITERVALECRGEVFNVGNRLNAIKVNAIYGNGAYPLSTFLRPIAGLANSDPARQFQFAMRLIW